jgi:hypothetical protein
MKKWTPIFVGLFTAAGLVGFDPARALAQPSLSAPSAALGTPAPGAKEQPEAPVAESSNRRVHRGFYLAAQLGGGYLALTSRNEGGVATLTGGGANVWVSAGASLIENLVLHADATTSFVNKPTLTYNDSDPVRAANVRANLWGFGGGATYFIMPLNVYVGGSLLLNQASIGLEGEAAASTDFGIGGALRAGKQFWIGDSWGVDLGTLFHAASMSEKNGKGQVFGWSLNVLAGFSLN